MKRRTSKILAVVVGAALGIVGVGCSAEDSGPASASFEKAHATSAMQGDTIVTTLTDPQKSNAIVEARWDPATGSGKLSHNGISVSVRAAESRDLTLQEANSQTYASWASIIAANPHAFDTQTPYDCMSGSNHSCYTSGTYGSCTWTICVDCEYYCSGSSVCSVYQYGGGGYGC